MNKFVALIFMTLALCAAPAQAITEKISVHGKSLEGNLEGNSADRDVFVVLPPSYAKEPNRRYPVVYFLHGFGDTMKFPHVFSSLYAMSSCCLIPRTLPVERAKAMDDVTLQQALKPDFDMRFDLAGAAAWSPAPNKPPLFLDSGAKGDALDSLAVAKWAANAPQAMLPQYLPALRSMKAISLEVGDQDFILADSNAMHAELNRYGIAHHFDIYDGDHGNRVPDRFQAKVLLFFAKHLVGRTR